MSTQKDKLSDLLKFSFDFDQLVDVLKTNITNVPKDYKDKIKEFFVIYKNNMNQSDQEKSQNPNFHQAVTEANNKARKNEFKNDQDRLNYIFNRFKELNTVNSPKSNNNSNQNISKPTLFPPEFNFIQNQQPTLQNQIQPFIAQTGQLKVLQLPKTVGFNINNGQNLNDNLKNSLAELIPIILVTSDFIRYKYQEALNENEWMINLKGGDLKIIPLLESQADEEENILKNYSPGKDSTGNTFQNLMLYLKNINPDVFEKSFTAKFYDSGYMDAFSNILHSVINTKLTLNPINQFITELKKIPELPNHYQANFETTRVSKNDRDQEEIEAVVFNNFICVEIPPDQKGSITLSHECIIAFLGLNKLRGKVPNFLYYYSDALCSPAIITENAEIISWCTTNNSSVRYAITENLANFPINQKKQTVAIKSTNLQNLCLGKGFITSEIFMSYYLQVLLSLRFAFIESKFYHGNCTGSNILIRYIGLSNFYIKYPHQNGNRYVFSNNIAIISNFVHSSITTRDGKTFGPDYSNVSPLADAYKLLLSCLSDMMDNNFSVFSEISFLLDFFTDARGKTSFVANQSIVDYYLPRYDSTPDETVFNNYINFCIKYTDVIKKGIVVTNEPTGSILSCGNQCEFLKNALDHMGLDVTNPDRSPTTLIDFINLYDLLLNPDNRGILRMDLNILINNFQNFKDDASKYTLDECSRITSGLQKFYSNIKFTKLPTDDPAKLLTDNVYVEFYRDAMNMASFLDGFNRFCNLVLAGVRTGQIYNDQYISQRFGGEVTLVGTFRNKQIEIIKYIRAQLDFLEPWRRGILPKNYYTTMLNYKKLFKHDYNNKYRWYWYEYPNILTMGKNVDPRILPVLDRFFGGIKNLIPDFSNYQNPPEDLIFENTNNDDDNFMDFIV